MATGLCNIIVSERCALALCGVQSAWLYVVTLAEWDLRNRKGANGHIGKRSLRVEVADRIQGGDEVLLCQDIYYPSR